MTNEYKETILRVYNVHVDAFQALQSHNLSPINLFANRERLRRTQEILTYGSGYYLFESLSNDKSFAAQLAEGK